MPEKSPLTEEYQTLVQRVAGDFVQFYARAAIKLTPPSGGGSRNPAQAVKHLRDRIRDDIPDAKTLPTAVYARGNAVRITNRGSYLKNIFVAPKGRAGRQARKKLTPAAAVLQKFSHMGRRAEKYQANGRSAERPLRRVFYAPPEPVWVRESDWNSVRRKKIAAAGGLLAAWAPVAAALKIRTRLPHAPAGGASSDITYDADRRHVTLKFQSALKPNGLPRMGMIKRVIYRNQH